MISIQKLKYPVWNMKPHSNHHLKVRDAFHPQVGQWQAVWFFFPSSLAIATVSDLRQGEEWEIKGMGWISSFLPAILIRSMGWQFPAQESTAWKEEKSGHGWAGCLWLRDLHKAAVEVLSRATVISRVNGGVICSQARSHGSGPLWLFSGDICFFACEHLHKASYNLEIWLNSPRVH